MTMSPVSLQDLRRRIYVTAKADKTKRFWGLYVHVARLETLRAAYDLAKRNNGAPGIDRGGRPMRRWLGWTRTLSRVRRG